jgi:phage I-like protein
MAERNGIMLLPLQRDDSAGVKIPFAPTDIAKVVRVNEARTSVGLAPLPPGDPNGDKFIVQLEGVKADPAVPAVASLLAASGRLQRYNALPAVDVSTAPSEFRLAAFGPNETTKGTFVLTPENAAAIVAQKRTDLMIDLEHLSLDQESQAFNPDAMGWARLEVRDDGLWAVNVKWTDEGRARIESRRQRYISPAITIDDSDNVTKVINAALTALPAMLDIAPLIAANARKERSTMPQWLKDLLTQLGMNPDEATEEEMRAAVAKHFADEAAPTPPQDGNGDDEEETASQAPAPEGYVANSAVAAIVAEAVKPFADRIKSLEKGQQRSDDDRKADIVKRYSDKLTPGLRQWLLSQSLSTVESYCEALKPNAPAAPPIGSNGNGNGNGNSGSVRLTAEDERFITKFGLDRDKYIAQRQTEKGAN